MIDLSTFFDAMRIAGVFAVLWFALPWSYLVATWCARQLDPSFVPPTWRSVWAWIGRQHVRVRIRLWNRGRLTVAEADYARIWGIEIDKKPYVPLTLVHPQSSRIDWLKPASLRTRAAKGVRWTSKGDRV